jgi:hypothetical protein
MMTLRPIKLLSHLINVAVSALKTALIAMSRQRVL